MAADLSAKFLFTMEMMQPFLGPKDLKDLLDKVKEDKNIGKSAEDNFRSLLDVSEHLEDIRWWFDGNKVNFGAKHDPQTARRRMVSLARGWRRDK